MVSRMQSGLFRFVFGFHVAFLLRLQGSVVIPIIVAVELCVFAGCQILSNSSVQTRLL